MAFTSKCGGLSDAYTPILAPWKGFWFTTVFEVTALEGGSEVAVYFPRSVPAHCADTPVKQAQSLSPSVSWCRPQEAVQGPREESDVARAGFEENLSCLPM